MMQQSCIVREKEKIKKKEKKKIMSVVVHTLVRPLAFHVSVQVETTFGRRKRRRGGNHAPLGGW